MAAGAAAEEHQKELASSLSDSGASVEEGCPQLEDEEQQHPHHGEEEDEDSGADEDASPGGARGKHGRNEKKARKAVLRHGLKHMPNITRVILRKNKHMLFTVAKPEVYKSTTSDTYVIFGEAKAEDLNSQAHSAAAQRFTQAPGMNVPVGYGGGEGSNSVAGAAAAAGRVFDGRLGGGTATAGTAAGGGGADGGEGEGDDEEVDETGVNPDDVQLVMSQVGCSRKRAVAALRLKNNDIVDAIIELSES